MSKEKIKQVAVQHFNRYGYEGTRMAQIALDAGIRKQSLSYHFPGKKELFVELYKETVDEEILFVRSYLEAGSGAGWEERLYHFLHEHKNRFLLHPQVQMMFVVAFLTPPEVKDFILTEFKGYMSVLKEGATRLLAQEQALLMTSEECAIAFITLLDGLDVQLVYESSQKWERALDVGWRVFVRGISAG